jgi:hypothetical protein
LDAGCQVSVLGDDWQVNEVYMGEKI